MNKQGYQGWANRATWNVALMINNDYGLYTLAKKFKDYEEFAAALNEMGIFMTMDGYSYTDRTLNLDELNAMLRDL